MTSKVLVASVIIEDVSVKEINTFNLMQHL